MTMQRGALTNWYLEKKITLLVDFIFNVLFFFKINNYHLHCTPSRNWHLVKKIFRLIIIIIIIFTYICINVIFFAITTAYYALKIL